jgi:glycosyltransferase involved in cell wall biosynthesis
MEPVQGGALSHLEYLLSYTDPAEFEVHLAVSARREPSVRDRFDAWRAAGAQVHEIPMWREISPRRDAAAFRRLLALCLRERFDVVHTHCAKAGFLGRLAGRASGARTVHTPHVFPFGRGGSGATERLHLALERRAARWTDRLVVLSRYQENLALRHDLLPPERTVLVPNGIVPERFAGADREAARKELGLGSGEAIALAAGRFCEQKGQDVLLDAVALLKRDGAAVRIVLLGSGPLEGLMRKQIEREGLGQHVTLRGPVRDVRTYYAACDLVLMPSRFEGMPYVLLEAKAAGRAAAVGLVSGMEEFVRHGEDGFLVQTGNPEAWAKVLAALAADRSAFHRAGEQAAAGFRPEWHASRSAGRTHEIYRKLCAEKERAQPGTCAGR